MESIIMMEERANEFCEKLMDYCKRNNITAQYDIKLDMKIYIEGDTKALEEIIYKYLSRAKKRWQWQFKAIENEKKVIVETP